MSQLRLRKFSPIGRDYPICEVVDGDCALLDVGRTDEGAHEMHFTTGASGRVMSLEVLGLVAKDGVKQQLLTDARGSVRLVVDVASGQVVQRLDYDAWGNVLRDTSPGLDNRRLFVFQEAGVPIGTIAATAHEIAAEAFKFTTKNGGTSVRVRGGCDTH